MGLDVSFKIQCKNPDYDEEVDIAPGRIGFVEFVTYDVVSKDYYGEWVQITKPQFRKICNYLMKHDCYYAVKDIGYMYFIKGKIFMCASW